MEGCTSWVEVIMVEFCCSDEAVSVDWWWWLLSVVGVLCVGRFVCEDDFAVESFAGKVGWLVWEYLEGQHRWEFGGNSVGMISEWIWCDGTWAESRRGRAGVWRAVP